MRNFFFLLFCLFFFGIKANAQCSVDAGSDINISLGGNTQLNAKPGLTELPVGVSNYLSCVYFFNADTGYIGTNGAGILKTIDGGLNWVQSNATSAIRKIIFTSNNIGYALGESSNHEGIILKTSNGGLTWETSLSLPYRSLFSMYFTSNSTGYVSVQSGKIYKTTNGGLNWTEYSTGSLETFLSMYFPNDSIGFIVSSNGKIFKTINSGYTWTSCISGLST